MDSDSSFAERKLDTILECAGRKWKISSLKPSMLFQQRAHAKM